MKNLTTLLSQKQFKGFGNDVDLMLNKVLSKSPGKSPLVKGPGVLWKAHQGCQILGLNVALLIGQTLQAQGSLLSSRLADSTPIPNYTST